MNIAKHSESTRARVNLDRRGDQLEMRIRDHGKGFSFDDAGRKGIGLVNMEERVRLLKGSLIINSNPGEGAEILVRLPVAPQGQQEHPQP